MKTRYTVVWVQGALDDLAELWTSHVDRTAIAAAADALDRILAEDAPDKGTELREGLRVLVVAPLRVIFDVREADRTVEILRVRRS